MLIQNFQNYECIFSKDFFSIIFQQFKKYIFKRRFLFYEFLKNVYSRNTFNLNSKILKIFFQKTNFLKVYLEKTFFIWQKLHSFKNILKLILFEEFFYFFYIKCLKNPYYKGWLGITVFLSLASSI